MHLTDEEVKKVAKLARLSLSEEETGMMKKQLSSILDYIEKMNEIDTSTVEPTAHILNLSNVFRKDEVKATMPVEITEKLAPVAKDGQIVVPKVI